MKCYPLSFSHKFLLRHKVIPMDGAHAVTRRYANKRQSVLTVCATRRRTRGCLSRLSGTTGKSAGHVAAERPRSAAIARDRAAIASAIEKFNRARSQHTISTISPTLTLA
jgi:hypothetical protein